MIDVNIQPKCADCPVAQERLARVEGFGEWRQFFLGMIAAGGEPIRAVQEGNEPIEYALNLTSTALVREVRALQSLQQECPGYPQAGSRRKKGPCQSTSPCNFARYQQ